MTEPVTVLPQIIIGLWAIPNVPTDGYHYIRHNTEPTAEMRLCVYQVAEMILGVLGNAIKHVSKLEFVFRRSSLPSELDLETTIWLELPGGITRSAFESYGISFEHMRTPERLNEFLIERLRNDVATIIYTVSRQQHDDGDTTAALLEDVGKPVFEDLY